MGRAEGDLRNITVSSLVKNGLSKPEAASVHASIQQLLGMPGLDTEEEVRNNQHVCTWRSIIH
jgi:hypothetical protein